MSKKSNELVIIQKITRKQNCVDFAVIKNTLLFKKDKSVIKQHDLRVKASKLLFKDIYGYGYDFPLREILDEQTIPSKIILEAIGENTILIFIYFNKYTDKINNSIDCLKQERCIGIDIGKKHTFAIANNINKKPILIKGTLMPRFYCEDVYKFKECLTNSISFMQKYINENKIDTVYVGDMQQYEPYATIVQTLLTLKNVKVIVINEANTSKSSFLDNDLQFGGQEFSGKRINRSTYKSKNGTTLSADINAAYNIIIKGNQFAFYNDIGIQIESEIVDITEIM